MKLQIEFAGMCMFARDPDDDEKLHVLLPRMERGHHPHLPRLYTKPAVLSQDVESDWERLVEEDIGEELAYRSLMERQIDLSQLSRGRAPDPPSSVVRLKDCAGTTLDPDVLRKGSDRRKQLATQITLRGGTFIDHEPGVEWTLGHCSTPRPMAISCVWEVDVGDLDSISISNSEGKPVGTVEFDTDRPVVRLHIFHTPPGETPSTPVQTKPTETSAPHFAAYYSLCKTDPRHVPKLNEKEAEAIDADPSGNEKSTTGKMGRRLSCILTDAYP